MILAQNTSKDVHSAYRKISELRDIYRVANLGPALTDLVSGAKLHRSILEAAGTGRSSEEDLAKLSGLGKRMDHDYETACQTVAGLEGKSRILFRRDGVQRRGRVSQSGSAVKVAQPAGPSKWAGFQANPPACPFGGLEPERFWWLNFDGLFAINVPEAEAHAVTDGGIGWEGLSRIDNDDTEQAWVSHLYMSWSGVIPRPGAYSFGGSNDTCLNLKWKSKGSGLWGADAIILIDFYSWVMVGTDVLCGYLDRIVDETKVAWGTAEDYVSEWLPTTFSGMFRAEEGERVMVYLDLQVETWSDDGRAWVRIDDFWTPHSSDPNHLIYLAD